jgi:hypothetical protein
MHSAGMVVAGLVKDSFVLLKNAQKQFYALKRLILHCYWWVTRYWFCLGSPVQVAVW